jgi:hypothetical protein
MPNPLFRSACVALALGFALCASAAPSVPGVTASTIVIGQSAPLSGSNRELGQDIRDGVLAYFKKVNDHGGVHGRRMELATLDDANDTKRSAENTRKLIEELRVFALYGYASATLSRPALPLVEEFKVPFIGPFTGAAPMRVFNKYVYNIRASYADELQKIVEHYSLFGIKRFAIVHYDDTVGRANYAIVERALKQRGLAPVSVAAFKDRRNPDIAGGVSAVLKGNPDVVILTTLYKTSARCRRCRRGDLAGGAPAVGGFRPGGCRVPRSGRESSKQERLFVHFARGVYRRQGDRRSAPSRRPEDHAPVVHACPRFDVGLRCRWLCGQLLA